VACRAGASVCDTHPALADGTVRLRDHVTHEFALGEYERAFDSCVRRRASGAVKVAFLSGRSVRGAKCHWEQGEAIDLAREFDEDDQGDEEPNRSPATSMRGD